MTPNSAEKPVNPYVEKELEAQKSALKNDTWNDSDEPTLDELLEQVDATMSESPEAERIQYMAETMIKLSPEKQQEQLTQLRNMDPEEADLVEEAIKHIKEYGAAA